MGGQSDTSFLSDAVLFDPNAAENQQVTKLIKSNENEYKIKCSSNPVVAFDGSVIAIMDNKGTGRNPGNRNIMNFTTQPQPKITILEKIHVAPVEKPKPE